MALTIFYALLGPTFIFWGYLILWVAVFPKQLWNALTFRDGLFFLVAFWGWLFGCVALPVVEVVLLSNLQQ